MLRSLQRDLYHQLFAESENRSLLQAVYLFLREPSARMTVVYRIGTAVMISPKLVR